MGLFDKFKQMANAVTGGGAKVSVQTGDAVLGQPIPVTVTAVVADADVNISSVYVLVRGQEIMQIDAQRLKSKLGLDSTTPTTGVQRRLIEHREESFTGRVDIAPAQTLGANQTHTFEGELRLPGGAVGTFMGKHISHTVQIQAGLDASGNDPDSGWVDLAVRAA